MHNEYTKPLFVPLCGPLQQCVNVAHYSVNRHNFTRHKRNTMAEGYGIGLRFNPDLPAVGAIDDLICVMKCESSAGHGAYWRGHLTDAGVDGVEEHWPVLWTVDGTARLRAAICTTVENNKTNPEVIREMCDATQMVLFKHISEWNSSTYMWLRASEDPRIKEVFGIENVRPVTAFTIGHDDATRRKANMKVCNVFAEGWINDDPEDYDTTLHWSPLPVQKIPVRLKQKTDLKARTKTASEGRFVLDTIGARFGKNFMAKMFAAAVNSDVDTTPWKNLDVPVCQLLVDQASYEMACWQLLSPKLPLVYFEAAAHRGSNTASSKKTKMRVLGQQIRSYMRGPKGKRANLGELKDTKDEMLNEIRDPRNPPPKWEYLNEAMAEFCNARDGIWTVEDVLEAPIGLQSSVNMRWWKCYYVAKFMKKNKYRLAMILKKQRKISPEEAAAAAARVQALEEGDLDLGGVSSDEEEDRQLIGNAESLLKAMEPLLQSTVYEDATIAFAEEGHDYINLLQNLSALPVGSVMPLDVAERFEKWTGASLGANPLVPAVKKVQIRLGQARWYINRKLIHANMKSSASFGVVGIEESTLHMQDEVSFALFQVADPNLGLWETLCVTGKAKFDLRSQCPSLVQLMQSLGFAPGSFAMAMATLYDEGDKDTIRKYILLLYGSRPYFELEQETCHKERWSNNDRRCRVGGSNFSMQRDRTLLALQHKVYEVPAQSMNIKYYLAPGRIVDTAHELQGYEPHQVRSFLEADCRGWTTSEVRNIVTNSATYLSEHRDAESLDYTLLPTYVANGPASRSAEDVGFRAAEVIVKMKLWNPPMWPLAESMSEKIAAELKIPARLDAGVPVLAWDPRVLRTVKVIKCDKGLLQITYLAFVYREVRAAPSGSSSSSSAAAPVQNRVARMKSTFAYPTKEEKVEVSAAWASELDWFLSACKYMTRSSAKVGRFVLDSDLAIEARDLGGNLAPKLSTAHKLLWLDSQRPRNGPKFTRQDLDSMTITTQATLIRKISDDNSCYESLHRLIRQKQLQAQQIACLDVDEFVPPAPKKKKNDENKAQKPTSPKKDSPRKDREEGGRQAAMWVAAVNLKGCGRIATIKSHRTTTGSGMPRLKLTYDRDYVAKVGTQTMSKQWGKGEKPIQIVEEFKALQRALC
eukprot:g2692.t1